MIASSALEDLSIVVEIVALLLGDRPDGRPDRGIEQQVGEADDVGERRAQLVGDVLHERALDAVGFLQRIGAFGQRALDVDRIGHVLERDERGAVGQRRGHAIEHAAVGAFEPRRDRLAAFERRHGAAQARPERVVAVERAAPAEHGLDMRLLGRAVERFRLEPPQAREGRIVQVEPPVAAEHRDALGERFERLALHADQRLVAAHQLEPLGHVVEQIGDAALGVGRGDDAHGAAVGQIPLVLARPPSPGRPRAGRSSSCGSRPAREACARRAGGPARRNRTARNRETPDRGPTARGTPRCRRRAADRPIDRDRGRKLVERAAVRLGHAVEFRAHPLDLGHVDADPGAPARRRPVDHVQDAARARHDDRQPRLVEFAGRPRALSAPSRAAESSISRLRATASVPSRASTARA